MLKPPTPGNVFVVSAASGTGKTTIVSRLLQMDEHIGVAISHTTRAPRPGEENGQNYFFTPRDEFVDMIGRGFFLEYAEVYGNYYGTSTATVEAMRQEGMDVILEIDVQGAAQIRQMFPNVVCIFILPPSLAALKQRLLERDSDSADIIQARLAAARTEIEQAYLFDYVITNDDLVQASQDILHIIHAQRLRQEAQQEQIHRILQLEASPARATLDLELTGDVVIK